MQESKSGLTVAQHTIGTTLGYMPGFGNDFETEALPGALPQGMNSPQKCNYGLYGEQLSGTPFTATSHENTRTWCYCIRPNVKHTHRLEKIDVQYWKSAPHIISSSSSGMSTRDIQEGAKHPERIILGHPFNPPYLILLVEVGGGALTSADVVDAAIGFYCAVGKKPIRINKEMKGHIASWLQVALCRETIWRVEMGAASVADIDIATRMARVYVGRCWVRS